MIQEELKEWGESIMVFMCAPEEAALLEVQWLICGSAYLSDGAHSCGQTCSGCFFE